MTAGQVVAVVALLAQMYGVDPALMDCMVYRESSYNVAAVNGVHTGVMQWNPSTLEWLSEKAANDPLWMHGYMDSGEPVYQIALSAWAVANGFGSHWSVWSSCEGEK